MTTESTLVIAFGPRFTQINFDFIFRRDQTVASIDPAHEKISLWEKSFHTSVDEVIFDLTITEWIATEQITFLFGWIRNIYHRDVRLIVRLPFWYDLTYIYNQAQLTALKSKYPEEKGYVDSPARQKRRKRSSNFLMFVYKLFEALDFDQTLFENLPPDSKQINREAENITSYNHQIIPFSIFNIGYNKQLIKYDTHFHDVINNNLESKLYTHSLFDLQESLQKILSDNYCYSPFANKILSNVITQELYINSLQHSYSEDEVQFLKEAYVTVFLSHPWEKKHLDRLSQRYSREKAYYSLDFYKDKASIRENIITQRLGDKVSDPMPKVIDLSTFSSFDNKSYLDFTFLDFGAGIPATLKNQFDLDTSNKNYKAFFSEGYVNASPDAKILEYALLLDSSKDPLDKSIEYYDLVPRGLYFLVDMVRRYHGMLTIRSGKGILICDFSTRLRIEDINGKFEVREWRPNNIRASIRHVANDEEVFYPGTMFNIVIPERKTDDKDDTFKSIAPVRSESEILSNYAYQISLEEPAEEISVYNLFKPEKFYYLSILFIYDKILEELRLGDPHIEVHVKNIYNRLIAEVNSFLNTKSEENCLIFFDFAGLKGGNTSWIKILYYLMVSPKVNELTKVIILNLPEDEQNLVKGLYGNYIIDDIAGLNPFLPEPYLYKPIPCISFDIDKESVKLINWIGLKYREDEILLTKLLLGQRQRYTSNKITEIENISGGLIIKQGNEILSSYSGLEDIITEYKRQRRKSISEFLNAQIQRDSKYVYLASSGVYQLEYLSLFNLLHDKYMARYFAKCLLDEYCSRIKGQLKEEVEDGYLNIDYSPFKIDKIMAVTITSQLLATSVAAMISENESYRMLMPTDKNGISQPPTLIMLSSYYSFESEKPFEKVVHDDQVLVVNDVISTGSLISKIVAKLEGLKKAQVIAVFSIADTRISEKNRAQPCNDDEVVFDLERAIDPKTFFLSLADADSGLVIRKYKGPYTGNLQRKRINPLLNTIVEFREENSEIEKVLYSADKLIDDKNIDADYLKIGHFAQNLTHTGYLTNLKPLFGCGSGYEFLSSLKNRLSLKYADTQKLTGESNIGYYFEKINERISSLSNSKDFSVSPQQLLSDLKGLQLALEAVSEDSPAVADYVPDFIFYPTFSGIESLGHFSLSKIFGTHEDNIVGLQRFETTKGWRFPVLADRFRQLTFNKRILILDTGSLTGDSLVQMIDTICVLDVKEICVLSVVTRVEDFNREMFSRIKSLTVKKNQKSLAAGLIHKSAPTDVFFGMNLQIPIYVSALSCPFCEELSNIKSINGDSHRIKPTHEVDLYIKHRIRELTALNVSKDELANIDYLPKEKIGAKVVPNKEIFKMRNRFGRIDTYRFYPDYFVFFNSFQSKISRNVFWWKIDDHKQTAELILICLLHEPQLIRIIDNYLNGLIEFLRTYLKEGISKGLSTEGFLFYNWKYYALLRVYYLLSPEAIFHLGNFETILSWRDENCRNYLHFIFWDILYKNASNDPNREKVESLLNEFQKNYDKKPINVGAYTHSNREFFRLIAKNYQIIDTGRDSTLDQPFYNLKMFVIQGQSMGRHFFLKDRLNEVIDAILEHPISLDRLKERLLEVVDILEKELLPNMEHILNDEYMETYCKSIYTVLSDKKLGILFYLKSVVSIYNHIKTYEQSELEDILEYLDKLKDDCKTLVTEKLDFNKKESFYSLSEAYPSDLLKTIRDLKNKNGELPGISFEIVRPQEEDFIMIAFHKKILDLIFLEIVKNAKENARKYSSDLHRVELVISLDKINADNEMVKLTIKQNFPFVPPEKTDTGDKEGGLTKIIQHYVMAFGGNVQDNREECLNGTVQEFEIYLILKLHKTQ
ncbi:hypothetical protein [Pedobacter sp. V48]|uniref:hypothetical protein n=1 Tax=Pedobacter sp. V48 TaxID=509635 RepID=UPI0003E521E5|nr:hypothetical protein [Pedobacter sp. V48]ETZ22843.1 hypothetical protein N824_21375 [Pedobacter sp. V48]